MLITCIGSGLALIGCNVVFCATFFWIFLDTIGNAIAGLIVGSAARWIRGCLAGGVVGTATNSPTGLMKNYKPYLQFFHVDLASGAV